MTDVSSNLPERLEVVEQKLDGLIQSVDARFGQVHAAIVEQRAYAEFAYEKLNVKMDAGFGTLDQKIDEGLRRVDGRFDRLERKIDQIMDLPYVPAGEPYPPERVARSASPSVASGAPSTGQ